MGGCCYRWSPVGGALVQHKLLQRQFIWRSSSLWCCIYSLFGHFFMFVNCLFCHTKLHEEVECFSQRTQTLLLCCSHVLSVCVNDVRLRDFQPTKWFHLKQIFTSTRKGHQYQEVQWPLRLSDFYCDSWIQQLSQRGCETAPVVYAHNSGFEKYCDHPVCLCLPPHPFTSPPHKGARCAVSDWSTINKKGMEHSGGVVCALALRIDPQYPLMVFLFWVLWAGWGEGVGCSVFHTPIKTMQEWVRCSLQTDDSWVWMVVSVKSDPAVDRRTVTPPSYDGSWDWFVLLPSPPPAPPHTHPGND